MFIFGTYGFSDSNEYQLQRKNLSFFFCQRVRLNFNTFVSEVSSYKTHWDAEKFDQNTDSSKMYI